MPGGAFSRSNLNSGWSAMKQHVILYDREGETQVYCTAYDQDEIKAQFRQLR